MTGGVKRGVTNPWLLEESEETRGLGFDDLRQQQRRIIEEQDAGLDALSSIISRQKQMGQEIGNELDEQNEIIDDLTNLVENTDDKLRNQTRHVKMVDKKSTSCVLPVALRPSRTTAAFSILPPSPGLAHSTSGHSSGFSAPVPPLPMCLLLAAVTPRVSPWITFADRDTSGTVRLRLHSKYSVNKGCRAVTNWSA
ncbi:syntaxin-8 isoform X11 [Calonectris borealis]